MLSAECARRTSSPRRLTVIYAREYTRTPVRSQRADSSAILYSVSLVFSCLFFHEDLRESTFANRRFFQERTNPGGYSPGGSSHYHEEPEGSATFPYGRGMKIFIWRLRADSGLRERTLPSRKDALISAYDGYVSQSETPTRPHSAPSTPIVRLIYVFSRVIRPPPPTCALVEEGRSSWRRRASRRPIVERLRRVDVGPTRTRRTIIIDGVVGRVRPGVRGGARRGRRFRVRARGREAGVKSTIEKRGFHQPALRSSLGSSLRGKNKRKDSPRNTLLLSRQEDEVANSRERRNANA